MSSTAGPWAVLPTILLRFGRVALMEAAGPLLEDARLVLLLLASPCYIVATGN